MSMECEEADVRCEGFFLNGIKFRKLLEPESTAHAVPADQNSACAPEGNFFVKVNISTNIIAVRRRMPA